MDNKFKNKNFIKKFEKLAMKFKLELIILFGSRAKEFYTNKSDYDIAILSKKELTPKQNIRLFEDLCNISFVFNI